MNAKSVVAKIHRFFSLNALCDNISSIMKLYTEPKVFIRDILLEKFFLARIGFPLTISEGNIGNVDIAFTDNNKIKLTITDFDVNALPFDNFLYEDLSEFEMLDFELEFVNLRILILVPPLGDDFVLITSEKITGIIDKTKIGSFTAQNISTFIGCTEIFQKNIIDFKINPEKSSLNFSSNIEIISLTLTSQQFESFASLWKSFQSKNFISNSFTIYIHNIDITLGSEVILHIEDMHITLGNKKNIAISKISMKIASIECIFHDINVTDDDFKINKFYLKSLHKLNLKIKSEPFIHQQNGQIVISPLELNISIENLVFLTDILKNCKFLDFIVKSTFKDDTGKFLLENITLNLHSGLSFKFSLTISINKKVKSFNLTQFQIYTDGNCPIVSDQICQIIIHKKQEIEKLKIFLSPLTMNFSFDDMPKVYRFISYMNQHVKLDEKRYLAEINLSTCFINVGVRNGNEFTPKIRSIINIPSITGQMLNNEIVYDFDFRFSIDWFSPVYSMFQPVISAFSSNIKVISSKEKINFQISSESTLRSFLSLDFLLFLKDMANNHDTPQVKKTFIENLTENKIILNKNKELQPGEIIIYQDKIVQFVNDMCPVPLQSIFDGFVISNDTIVKTVISDEMTIYKILPKMKIHNYLPIPIGIYSKNRNLIFKLSPNEEKELKHKEFIVASSQLAAKSSEKINIDHAGKIFSKYLHQNNQNLILVDVTDCYVNIHPGVVIVNEIGSKFTAIHYSGESTTLIEVEESTKALIPYSDHSQLSISIKIDNSYSNIESVDNVIEVPIENGYIPVISKRQTNKIGQIEIIFLPKFKFVNYGKQTISIHMADKTIDLDKNFPSSHAIFRISNFSSAILPQNAPVSIKSCTEPISIPLSYDGILKLPSSKEKDLIYLVHCRSDQYSAQFNDAVVFINNLSSNVTISVHNFYSSVIKPHESFIIDRVDENCAVQINVEGFSNSLELCVEYPNISPFILFGDSILVVDVRIEKSDKGFIATIESQRKPIYTIINSTNLDFTVSQRLYEEFNVEVPRMSSIPFGFHSNISPQFVNIQFTGSTYSVPFSLQGKMEIELPREISIEIKSLGNGTRAMIVYEKSIDNIDLPKENEKKFVFSINIHKISINIIDHANHLARFRLKNVLSTVIIDEIIDFEVLINNLVIDDNNTKIRCLEQIYAEKNHISLKLQFENNFDLRTLQKLAFKVGDSSLCYSNQSFKTLRQFFSHYFNNCLNFMVPMHLKHINISPMKFVLFSPLFSDRVQVNLPGIKISDPIGSFSTIFTILGRFYDSYMSRFNNFFQGLTGEANLNINLPPSSVSAIELHYEVSKSNVLKISSTKVLQSRPFPNDYLPITNSHLKTPLYCGSKLNGMNGFICELPHIIKSLATENVFYYLEIKKNTFLCFEPHIIFIIDSYNKSSVPCLLSSIKSLIIHDDSLIIATNDNQSFTMLFDSSSKTHYSYLIIWSLIKLNI